MEIVVSRFDDAKTLGWPRKMDALIFAAFTFILPLHFLGEVWPEVFMVTTQKFLSGSDSAFLTYSLFFQW